MYLKMNIFFIKKQGKHAILSNCKVVSLPSVLGEKTSKLFNGGIEFSKCDKSHLCTIFCIINYQYTDSLDTWNCIVPLNSNDIYFVK